MAYFSTSIALVACFWEFEKSYLDSVPARDADGDWINTAAGSTAVSWSALTLEL